MTASSRYSKLTHRIINTFLLPDILLAVRLQTLILMETKTLLLIDAFNKTSPSPLLKPENSTITYIIL